MVVAVANNTKSGFYNSVDGTVEVDSIIPRWPYSGFETPAELTGTSAIDIPAYNGIEHLQVLDKNWVVVMIDFSAELFAEIDTLSSGVLQTAYDDWTTAIENAAQNPPLGGGAYVDRNLMWNTRREYIAQARANVGELTLETTAAYGITSADDANYSSSQNPISAARYCYSAGPDTTYLPLDTSSIMKPYDEGGEAGVFQDAYFACGYIQLPTSMVDGDTYTITVLGKTVTFLFDRKKTISRAIKINQEGYMSDATSNKAFMGAYLYEEGQLDLSHAPTFEVINADTGIAALSGSVVLREANPLYSPGGEAMYGEDVYEMDFSALAGAGTYYISVPGVGRSWPFEYSTSAMDYAAYTALRCMYHHRAGSEVTTKHTYWPRRLPKQGPYYYECEHIFFPQHDTDYPSGYDTFDAIANTIDVNQITVQGPGGHNDAADWDCRGFHYASVANLLYAFQFNSTNLASDTWLDLPDSGNGVPDILKEARHGLEVWRLSQGGNGGVSGYLETWTHPSVNHDPDSDGLPWRKPHYAYGQRTRWSSLMFAACAAHYARLVFDYDATDSALYQTAAENAYTFGNNPANSLGSTTLDGFAWTELQSHVDPYLMWAKLQLYLLTDTESYLTDSPSVVSLEATIPNPYVWTWSENDYSGWIYYGIIEAYNAGYAPFSALRTTWRNWFINRADEFHDVDIPDNPYEKAHPRTDGPSRWALNHTTMHGAGLIIAHQETGLAKYRDALIKNLDFMLGANAIGMSFCTGIGYSYPVFINNEVSRLDDIKDPVPGITVYGITTDDGFGGGGASFENEVWRAALPGQSAITSLTQTGGLATAVMVADHGLTTGDRVEILNRNSWDATNTIVSEWNTIGAVVTVTGAKTFTFSVDSGIAATAPATTYIYRDFTYDSHRAPAQPKWRRFMQHPTSNVPQCEYTIQDSVASMLLSTAYLYSGTTVTQRTPRDPQYLWGKWLLP